MTHMLVDSHCHLDYPDFAEDREAVLQRARQAGVGFFLSINTKVRNAQALIDLVTPFPDVACTVGTHPHEAEAEQDVTYEEIIALARHPKVIGIGETGLDYYYNNSPADIQKASFRRHIRAALELDMPVIIHTRDADEDTLQILREEAQGTTLRGILHCFSSGRHLAEEGVKLGLYVSFSGIVTFKKSDELRSIAKDLPLDHLLVETDAPFLAPQAWRGKRNEPGYVVHMAEELARLHDVPLATVAEKTTANFKRLFGLEHLEV